MTEDRFYPPTKNIYPAPDNDKITVEVQIKHTLTQTYCNRVDPDWESDVRRTITIDLSKPAIARNDEDAEKAKNRLLENWPRSVASVVFDTICAAYPEDHAEIFDELQEIFEITQEDRQDKKALRARIEELENAQRAKSMVRKKKPKAKK